MAGLGDLAGGAFESEAWSTSADGLVVVGYSVAAIGRQPFKWTPDEQMTGFGGEGIATDLSDTAAVVVGFAPFSTTVEGFRGAQGQPFLGLGDLPGGTFGSTALATSSNGDVVVGFSSGLFGDEAFRWLLGVGMIGIGDLPGGQYASVANGVSASGAVVVGRSASSSGFEAFRWTIFGGMVGLGDLQGGIFDSSALDISEDGDVVVGYGHSNEGQQATIWTPESGMIPFTAFLSALGVDIGTRTLERARRVSSDGLYVAGTGRNEDGDREAWIAYLPEAYALAGQTISLMAVALLRRFRTSRSRPWV
jgi:probable HAF family extracellular repeat protein